MGCFSLEWTSGRAKRQVPILRTRSRRQSRAARNCSGIRRLRCCCGWPPRSCDCSNPPLSGCFRRLGDPLPAPSTVAPSRVDAPACSCADHVSPGLRTKTSRATPRTISSNRAGVPYSRTHTLGYSTGNVKSNFRLNHAGTSLIPLLRAFSVNSAPLRLAFFFVLTVNSISCPAPGTFQSGSLRDPERQKSDCHRSPAQSGPAAIPLYTKSAWTFFRFFANRMGWRFTAASVHAYGNLQRDERNDLAPIPEVSQRSLGAIVVLLDESEHGAVPVDGAIHVLHTDRGLAIESFEPQQSPELHFFLAFFMSCYVVTIRQAPLNSQHAD